MSGFRPPESPLEPPETPKSPLPEEQLRYFRNKNKNKNAQDVHNSDASNISSNSTKLPNAQDHDVVNPNDSYKSYNSDEQNVNKSINESITTSISEHIVKYDSAENSVTNNDTSHGDLSIPSLHLKSLSRSDSEFGGLQQSVEGNSKLSSSSHEYISDENVSEENVSKENISRKSSILQNSSNEKVVAEKNISKNDNVLDNNERISNESSIHTLFDTSSSKLSDKSRNSVNDHETEESASKEIDLSKQKTDLDILVESESISPKSNIIVNEINDDGESKSSSVSEEIIKVDIRGTATRGFPFPQKLLFFSNLDSTSPPILNDYIALNDKVVNLSTLGPLPRILEKPSDVQINLDQDNSSNIDEDNLNTNDENEQKSSNKQKSEEYEQDYEIEEMFLNKSRNIFQSTDNEENVFTANNGNKPNTEGDTSLSTIATEYKTLGEDYQLKIPEFEETLLQRDVLINKLKVSLTNSHIQKDRLQSENEYLSSEVSKLQQLLSDVTSSNAETKGQLSDFAKHENLISDENSEIVSINANIKNKSTIDNFSQTNGINSDVKNQLITNTQTKASDYLKSVTFFSGIENYLNELTDEELPLFHKFKDKLEKLMEIELHNKYETFSADLNHLNEKLVTQDTMYKMELKRFRDLIISIKSNNPELLGLRNEMEIKHQKEMEELRTYFEQKCAEMEKHYSEEVFSTQSKKISANSSTDSLNNCPEALPFGSPFHRVNIKSNNILPKKLKRSRSFELPKSNVENLINDVKNEHNNEISKIIEKHDNYVSELITYHETYLSELEEKYKQQIADLKADLQTYQNTEMNINISQYEHRDTDLELEKEPLNYNTDTGTKDVVQTQALLSDPNSDLSSWPLNLIALKDKIETETKQTIEQLKMKHEEELTALREENNKQALEVQKYASKEEEWRSKRQEAFDRNRHLEDVIKERDGLKHMIVTLQKVLSQLVEYFNLCEDELNNTVVGELLKQVMLADENFDNTIVLNCTIKSDISQNQSLNNTFDENNISTQISKKISFVPNVNEIMTYIDVDCSFDGLDQTQDISLNFKHDLDSCLKKLRTEAQELLALSAQRIPKRLSILGNVEQKEEVVYNEENIDSVLKKDLQQKNEFQDLYEKSEESRKELQESLAQSMFQEIVLKRELQIAMEKIAELLNEPIPDNNKEIISEGYGIVTHPRLPVSLPPHPRVAITSPPPLLASEGNTPEGGRSISLDGILDKRASDNHEIIRRLTSEIEMVSKEKEDLQMQLEAANKQLKSTRQFLEEQAAEREQERDEYQSQLEQLKEENSKLATKTQHHTRVCKEAEQLEMQIREMTCLVTDTENKRINIESDLKSTVEKSLLLRDIISNLEGQIEKKTSDEVRILEELAQMKEIADEKDIKISEMVKELETLRDDIDNRIANDILKTNENNSNNIAMELEIEKKVVEQMRGQLEILVDILTEHTVALENLHEAVCSQSCSSPSEDVSIRNQKKQIMDESSFVIPTSPSKLLLQLPLLEISRLGDTVHKHLKAEDAAVKRIRDLEMQLIQLKDVAQELRAERDILQERMSEQSLRISSLQSRLDQTRHTAEQIRHQSTEELRLQLDEAHSEIQLLRESLDSRDKQVARLKSLVDKKNNVSQDIDLDEESNKNIVQSLKKELSDLQLKHKELEEANELNKSIPEFLESIVADKNADIEALKQKLQAVLKLNINEEEILKELSQNEDEDNQGRISGRTLSDILSISEFDEPELMRKAELKPHSCISENLHVSFNGTKNHNITSITEMEKKLPLGTSTDLHMILEDQDNSNPNLLDDYKRNINETTMFGASVKSGKYKMEECELTENSLFPNKNASDNRNISVEPKKLNFSLINSTDENYIRQSLQHELINLSNLEIEELFESFKEYGIEFKLQSNNRYNILAQIRNYVNSLKEKLKVEESSVKNLEKQFNEFLNVQNEVEKLRESLQNNLKKMDEDKLYYNEQLEKFVSGESALKNQLQQAINDSNEKANELQILKEDIVRRENLVLELSKEKRSLQKGLLDLEQKHKIIESKYKNIDKENVGNLDNITHIQGLEALILEKNQQIDSLNVDLDKLDDVQRELNNKKIEIEKLHAILNEKSIQLEEVSKVNNKLTTNEQNLLKENSKLSSQLKEFTEINLSLKQENGKLNDGLQILESKLKNNHYKSPRNFVDKDTSFGSMDDNVKDTSEGFVKIQDFENFFSELNNLIFPDNSKIMSPREKKWNFNSIKKHITKLEVENHLNRKELNETVFKLERAKLDIIDLKTQAEEFSKHLAERDELLQQVSAERDELQSNLKKVIGKLREESNLEELNFKLNKKVEECNMLEHEVISLKTTIERFQRDMISVREKDNCLQELSAENGRLKHQLVSLKNKITEQDVLISDLNEDKENLVADLQELEEKSELEKDTSVRLKLLLDSEKQMANSIQNQDSNVIQILKDRLEVALDSESELKMLLEREKKSSEQYSKQLESLKKQLKHLEEKVEGGIEVIPESINVQLTEKLDRVTSQFDDQVEITDLLKSEIMLLNSKRDRDKSRLSDLQNVLDREKLWFQKEIDSSKEQINSLKHELSELMRQKHEMHLELVNSREKLHLQKNDIIVLEKRLTLLQESNKSVPKPESYRALLNDLEKQNKDLILEISSLKSKLELSTGREKSGFDRQGVGMGFDDESSTLHHLKEMQSLLTRHIKENVQISETVKELTQERRELQRKVQQLEESNIKGSSRHATSLLSLPEGVDQQVRFLYGSYMRVQSYRKALIWQKRYLTTIAKAFEALQFEYTEITPIKSTGIERWRRIVISIQSVFRMKYLVRRWQTGSRLASNIHLNIPNVYPSDLRSSKSFSHIPSSLNKKEMRSRQSLQNPSTSHYTSSTKRTNKSWSMGSALNLTPSERITDRHLINPQSNYISRQYPHQNASIFRENAAIYEPDNWNSINDQPS